MIRWWFVLLLPLVLAAPSCRAGLPVRTGADVLVEQRLDLVRARRIGLITNQTGVLSNGTALVDTLTALGVQVTALFAPEHGIRGASAAGESVADTVDDPTGIPVFSLYGGLRKPTRAMLGGIDLLVYDLQDVGARFFTYISTMKLAMEAAAEAGIPFVVLDRPNPLGGNSMDGPVIEDGLRSFIGAMPIPVVYGLTCGELALMINGEGWLAGGVRAQLTVVTMEGWRRSMLWKDTHHAWIKPSPNMPSAETALLYPGTCLIEATSVSEGRGTERPFQMVGAPFIDGETLTGAVRRLPLAGIVATPRRYIPGASKYAGRECGGVFLEVADAGEVNPLVAGVSLLQTLLRLYPDSVRVDRQGLRRLLGSTSIVDRLLEGENPEALRKSWESEVGAFRENASKYFVYEE